MANKRGKLGSENSDCIFTDKQDIQQFKTLFNTIKESESLNKLKAPTAIYKEIAEYACGVIRVCNNEDCESKDKQIVLLLSEIADHTLYKNDDIVIDVDTKGFFGNDDESTLIYCKECKEHGYNCGRCGSFAFYRNKCYRCSISICELCGAICEHRRCKIVYCIGGDVSSFTSGCGERFLDELECIKCDEPYMLCHGHQPFIDEFECYKCKRLEKKRKKKEERKRRRAEKEKHKEIEVSKIINLCKECKNKNDDGRICDNCGKFVCKHHIEQYKNFCAGACQLFYCDLCIKEHGKLSDCPRESCEYMVCAKCTYKCENCWDLLMMNGFDDAEIEAALRDGDYSDLE